MLFFKTFRNLYIPLWVHILKFITCMNMVVRHCLVLHNLSWYLLNRSLIITLRYLLSMIKYMHSCMYLAYISTAFPSHTHEIESAIHTLQYACSSFMTNPIHYMSFSYCLAEYLLSHLAYGIITRYRYTAL